MSLWSRWLMVRRRAGLTGVISGLATIVLATTGRAQGPADLVVTRMGDASISAKPARPITVAFRVRNTTDLSRSVFTAVDLPAGWRLATGGESFVLAPHGDDMRILSFRVPDGAIPGRYSIRYGLDRKGDQSGVDSVMIAVEAAPALGVTLVDSPASLPAGKTYVARFLVRNDGNTPVEARVHLQSSDALPARSDSTALHLRVGEAKQVAVTVHTDEAQRRPITHRLRLTAVAAQDTTVRATTISTVDIVPSSTKGGSLYYHLPATLTFRGTSPSEQGAPLELQGAGRLADGSPTTIDFLFRGPQREQSPFGDRSEYRFAIHAPAYDLRLGDQITVLTPLTEPGRYGFGVSAQAERGPVSSSAFAVRDRWAYDLTRDREYGATVRSAVGDRASIGANFVSHTSAYDTGDIWTMQGNVSPIAGSTVALEYGRGNGSVGQGQAYRAQVIGNYDRVSFDAQHLAQGGDYPGYYRGGGSDNAAIHYQPSDRLSLNGQYSATSYEYSQNGFDVVNDYRSAQLGANYNGNVGVYARSEARTGRFAATSFDAIKNSAWVYAGMPVGRVRVSGTVERGRVNDRILGETRPLARYTAHADTRFGALVLGVSGERFDGHTLYSPFREKWNSGTAVAHVSLDRRTQAMAFWTRTTRTTPVRQQTDVAEAQIERRMYSSQLLRLRTRMISFGGNPGFSSNERIAQVEYVIPFGLPTTRLPHLGTVAGRIHGDGLPADMANIMVRLGSWSVFTDSDGRFAFHGIPAGKYYLSVEPRGIDPAFVPESAMPRAVTVKEDQTVTVDAPYVRSATVTGAVRVSSLERTTLDTASMHLVDSAAVSGAVVEISRDGEVLRRVTDSTGTFVFHDLRPGVWTVRVSGGSLPASYHFEQPELSIDLVPGGASEPLLFRAVPRRRQIRIVPNGEGSTAPARPFE